MIHTKEEIERRKAFMQLKIAERDVAQLEVEKAQQDLLEACYKRFSWNELENWLKQNRPANDYDKNPIIRSLNWNHYTYCFITSKGELQIGPYYHNDRFPRGEDVYISVFESWR